MNVNPKQLPNESVKEYKYRICENKELLGLTWEGVCELLNKELDLDFGESYYRKWYVTFKDGREHAIEHNLSKEEEIMELDEKIKDLEIAKIQLQDQKREYRQYLRHEARLDNLLKKLIADIKDDINKVKPLKRVDQSATFKSNSALTLLLSDLHRGMVTDNHWNKFNEKVFSERIAQTISEVKEYQKVTSAKELHILELGDAIEGNLHRLTKIGETEDAVKQTKAVAEALSEMVAELSGHFDQIHFYSVKGNHDRASSRKEEEIKTESFHEFIVWYMQARLEKDVDNVVFHNNAYDDEIIVADILGQTYFGVHGHLESYPNMIQNLTLMIRKFPTAVFAGHIHKNFENEIHSIDLIVNGGFAGTNGYAKDGRMTSKAHQKLLWLDENGRRATFYIKY